MAENWLPIPGFAGRYEVSDFGRIRRTADGKPIVGAMAGNGRRYRYVRLTGPDGRKCIKPVHTQVLLAFVGPRPEGMLTRHLNGDGSDNRLVNLVYGTQSENMRDRTAHGTCTNANKTHCKRGHEFTPDNIYKNGGGRNCKICVRAATARSKKRRAEMQS